MTPSPIVFESHVTLEPCFDDRLELLVGLCGTKGFRVANLLMQKDRLARPERSTKDTFTTGHDQDYDSLKERMSQLVDLLRLAGFKVWRAKIEAVLFDVKFLRERR